jgi:hypothetical protein
MESSCLPLYDVWETLVQHPSKHLGVDLYVHPALDKVGVQWCYEEDTRAPVMASGATDVPVVDTQRGFLEVRYGVIHESHSGYCSDVDSPAQIRVKRGAAKAWFPLPPSCVHVEPLLCTDHWEEVVTDKGVHSVCGCTGTVFRPTAVRVLPWRILEAFLGYPSRDEDP